MQALPVEDVEAVYGRGGGTRRGVASEQCVPRQSLGCATNSNKTESDYVTFVPLQATQSRTKELPIAPVLR
ncbi:MAG: hypothetical protein SFV81_30265, partial [Pirellulaceae bacterium]|nr:hypothetical protein [Pirellulaceae bacterium]